MSAHMKGPRTKYIDITISFPNGKEKLYHIPNTEDAIKQLSSFLKKINIKDHISNWEESTPWELLAKDRLEKYKKSGIVLRGARYREGLSQTELAMKSGVAQNEISKIENGKRGVGEKVAKKLAKILNIDYLLLIEN